MTDNVVEFADARAGKRDDKRADRRPGKRAPKGGDGGQPPPPPLPPVDPGPCPVTAIGHFKGRFYFFNAPGELIELPAQALGQSPQLVAMFGERHLPWLATQFPQFDREGNPTGWFSVRNAGASLVQACMDAGIFERTEPERGPGVWTAQGRIAVHLGDVVRFQARDGTIEETRPAGFRARGALWPAFGRYTAPAPPADAEIAGEVERMFARWTWSRPGEERVFTGLYAAGLLGAAIRWRPHGLLVGPPGSGKSTLVGLYGALSPLSFAVNDYTEAGVRQFLTGRAAPLLLDEADEDPDSMGRLQKVIGLLRRASGGDGAQVVRGSGDGKPQRFDFTSPALLGAVLPPPLLPQDATRITRVDLCQVPPHGAPLPIDRMLAWSREHAPAIWGRAIAGVPRFLASLEVVRGILIESGCSPRLADQVGTIVAARAMLMEDEPLDTYAAVQDIEAVSWLAVTEAEQLHDSGPMRCLHHLLASPAELTQGGARPTFDRLCARARVPSGDHDALVALMDHGLLVTPWPRRQPGATPHLLVASSHPALARVFRDTGWAGNRWCEDLRRLPGAVVPRDPVSFRAGLKPRCVAIPPEIWAGLDHDADPAPRSDEE